MSQFADLIYEIGMLNRISRSRLALLGAERRSISEHVFREMHIARLLVRLSQDPVDELHVLDLVMFRHLPEARTGDLNGLYSQYDRVDKDKLFADLEKDLPFGQEIVALVRELGECSTAEAQIANDAEHLGWIATLKELADVGNHRAAAEIAPVRARLNTAAGKRLAEELITTPSDDWWFRDKQDQHWVDRGRNAK